MQFAATLCQMPKARIRALENRFMDKEPLPVPRANVKASRDSQTTLYTHDWKTSFATPNNWLLPRLIC